MLRDCGLAPSPALPPTPAHPYISNEPPPSSASCRCCVLPDQSAHGARRAAISSNSTPHQSRSSAPRKAPSQSLTGSRKYCTQHSMRALTASAEDVLRPWVMGTTKFSFLSTKRMKWYHWSPTCKSKHPSPRSELVRLLQASSQSMRDADESLRRATIFQHLHQCC